MATARYVLALIERYHPGSTLSAVEAAVGARRGTLAERLKPSANHTDMWSRKALREFARVIGCTENEVYRARLLDIDPEARLAGLPDDEAALLACYRQLTTRDQRMLRGIAALMTEFALADGRAAIAAPAPQPDRHK